MRILVLGGTRFFGKQLVNQLLEEGHSVSIATRGNNDDKLDTAAEKLIVDRYDVTSMKELIRGRSYDVVYDQLCYSSLDAQYACQAFDGHIGKLIYMSSHAVYDQSEVYHTEEAFHPREYPIVLGERKDFSYPEGKKQGEAVFAQQASFPVLSVRFPFVLGIDDYTKRLNYYVDKMIADQVIYQENLSARLSFISSQEAGQILSYLKNENHSGAINGASLGDVSIVEVAEMIEHLVHKKGIIQSELPEGHEWSPFSTRESWLVDCTKLIHLGYIPSKLQDWLPELIERLCQEHVY